MEIIGEITERKLIVLMAEDNEHDIVATKRAWKKLKISNPLIIVNDGQECLDFLRKENDFKGVALLPLPKLLLLDIKMPKKDGITVLKEIKEDVRLKNLPVVMLTSSQTEQDRVSSYNLGVNAYVVKPIEFGTFSEALLRINLFWEIVEHPGI